MKRNILMKQARKSLRDMSFHPSNKDNFKCLKHTLSVLIKDVIATSCKRLQYIARRQTYKL